MLNIVTVQTVLRSMHGASISIGPEPLDLPAIYPAALGLGRKRPSGPRQGTKLLGMAETSLAKISATVSADRFAVTASSPVNAVIAVLASSTQLSSRAALNRWSQEAGARALTLDRSFLISLRLSAGPRKVPYA